MSAYKRCDRHGGELLEGQGSELSLKKASSHQPYARYDLCDGCALAIIKDASEWFQKHQKELAEGGNKHE